LLPASAFAVNSSLTVNGPYTTGTDSQFTINLDNYDPSNSGMLSLINTDIYDLAYAKVLTSSGWASLGLTLNNGDVIANVSPDAATKSIIIKFKTPRSYVLGYTVKSAGGQVLTSTAAPVDVTGAQILGESITVTFTRQLKYGSSGADVTALQKLLASQGLFTVAPTGFFGRVTQAAVKAYQIAHNISPANGVVGPATLASLNK